jgi:hypothetical protein
MGLCGVNRGVLSLLLAFDILVSVLVASAFVPTPSSSHFKRKSAHPNQEPRHSLSSGQEPEPDLFDYFDPLLSPHAYPNGISPGTKPIMDMEESNKGADKIDSFARENRPALAEEPKYNQEQSSSGNSKPSGRGKIGVLLMDHGSRNEASNSRLLHLAKLYQLSSDEENIIVQHAHMEIASPSIAEGLEKLMNQGVGTCR